ncbi:hypothetical protein V6N12_047396 [Hibiscus sabdariffa]|uniref:Uncharacterized protein n=1 Tax=Hibiscus sabdariffa TaxID=183260 RepID=A0ABR2DAR0_9ROSI
MYWRRKKKQDGEGSNVKNESMVESLKPTQDRKRVLGVVDENNLEILRNSAVGRYHDGFYNGLITSENGQRSCILTVDLLVRVWKVEYPYKSENSEDLSAGVSVDEDESTHVQSDLGVEAVVSETTLQPSHISNSKSVNSKETMVPNSYEMNYDQTRLEQSKRVDLRVCDSQTIGTEVVSDAYMGLIIRSDLELPKLDVMQLIDLHVSPIAHTTGPLVDNSDTLPRAIRIKIGAVDRKVRYLDDLMQRETATKKQPALKRGRGRPRK